MIIIEALRPAASRTTDHRRQPSPSESTPHDHRH
jgi:hypothetical protein